MTREPHDYIVFPLDVPDRATALNYVNRLSGKVGLFKVGLELFIAEGPDMVRAVTEAAGPGKVFLDLKLHDIPATVGRALKSAAGLGVKFATVHADALVGLSRWMAEATQAGLGVLAVTVLTSLGPDDLARLGYTDSPSELVLRRAQLAKDTGCAGVVCSGLEAKGVREVIDPGMVIVTPGIRPAWTLIEGDDQRRVVTPKMAVDDGSDYLVIGRPIRDADDPAEAADKVAQEIADE